MRGLLAKAFGVARSSSYRQHIQPVKDEVLLKRIEASMATNPAYGYIRVALDLDEGLERVRRIMQANDLRPAVRRHKAWRRPPDSASLEDELKNLIKEINPRRPFQIWASDFTYIWFQGRWYYLATILDLFTREIVGWQLGRKHRAQLIHLAYCDALSRHPPSTIVHADQGSEYTARSTKRLVELNGGEMSFSNKGSPWQNGHQESFYGHFKLELGDINRFEHEGELFEAIAKQLYYYNNQRIHTALKTNPAQYRKTYLLTKARE